MKLPKLKSVLRAARSGQLWYVAPHYYYRRRNPGRAERTPPAGGAPYGTPGAFEVCMMTGEPQHYDLLLAAKSFLKYFPAPVSLAIHCDKSVTPDAISRMQRHLPNAKIWSRADRDAIVEPYLKTHGFDRCIGFRQRYVYSTRLIDAYVLSKADRILFLDSDILSFRPLTRLYRSATAPTPTNVFGKDPAAETHGLTREKLRDLFGVTDIKNHLNGGFCVICRSVVDHKLLNDWLGVPGFPWQNYFLEQMFLVLLMAEGWGRKPLVELLPPDEYNMGRTIEGAEDVCSLVHYCGHYLSRTRMAMHSIGQPRVIAGLNARN